MPIDTKRAEVLVATALACRLSVVFGQWSGFTASALQPQEAAWHRLVVVPRLSRLSDLFSQPAIALRQWRVAADGLQSAAQACWHRHVVQPQLTRMVHLLARPLVMPSFAKWRDARPVRSEDERAAVLAATALACRLSVVFGQWCAFTAATLEAPEAAWHRHVAAPRLARMAVLISRASLAVAFDAWCASPPGARQVAPPRDEPKLATGVADQLRTSRKAHRQTFLAAIDLQSKREAHRREFLAQMD